jgi:hypothetical protein
VVQSAVSDRLRKGVESSNVSVVGDYAVNNQWLQKLYNKAREFASSVAEENWEQEDSQRIKPTVLTSTIGNMIAKDIDSDHDKDKSSVLSILTSGNTELSTTISKAYASKFDELELSCDEQFNRQWISRVVDKVRLHAPAIHSMEDGNLKTQLEELLRTHITTDIIPQTSNRAKAKRLLRSHRLKLSSRLPKLRISLEETKDLASTVEEIEKFNSKIGVEKYDEKTLQEKSRTHLADMVEAMTKDEDSPRLFLCLIIILSSSQYPGVLYATGKYAPRLMKALKHTMDSEQAQWLEQVKDAIKAGDVTEEMKEKMRKMASEAIVEN